MKNLVPFLFILSMQSAFCQHNIQKPDLKDPSLWTIYNRLSPAWKDTIVLNKTQEDGMMMLRNFEMGNGTIELDLKGENIVQQSFIGIAFNVQDDKTYEHVYFRPFNFMNADTARRSRAVQYASLPDFPWPKLRESYPGKYENKVKPVPDPNNWFHAKIVIEKPFIRVYVNTSAEPCLVVESLAPERMGKIGLWTGPMTRGSFTNLIISPVEKK